LWANRCESAAAERLVETAIRVIARQSKVDGSAACNISGGQNLAVRLNDNGIGRIVLLSGHLKDDFPITAERRIELSNAGPRFKPCAC
jgi:hypothetical protein